MNIAKIFFFRVYEYLNHQWHSITLGKLPDSKTKSLLQTIFIKTKQEDFIKIEAIRATLLKSNKKIQIEDFGAGATLNKGKQRRISSIARSALSSKRQALELSSLAQFIKAKRILELGTSLGITTSYLSIAAPLGQVVTFEGANSIAEVAQSNFSLQGLKNIKVITGNFDDTLQAYLDANPEKIDLAFIDGNHSYDATLSYFKKLIKNMNSNGILVIDDIYWSSGMAKAWKSIQNHPVVECSFDLYHYGLIILNSDLSGHYKILKKIFLNNTQSK